jgi:hypothetical protein
VCTSSSGDSGVRAADPAAPAVHDEVAVDRHRRQLYGVVAGAAAQHRVHAQHQLAGAEGLGDVVVGTGLETEHAVLLGAERGEQDDRHVTGKTQAAAHLEAVHPGHHHVEDQQVGAPACVLGERGGTVAGLSDVVARGEEVGHDHLADGDVVVDDQHARHVRRPPDASAPGRPRRPRRG